MRTAWVNEWLFRSCALPVGSVMVIVRDVRTWIVDGASECVTSLSESSAQMHQES